MGAPHRRTIYTASLEAHVDRLHAQLLDHNLFPVAFDALDAFHGLNSKTAKVGPHPRSPARPLTAHPEHGRRPLPRRCGAAAQTPRAPAIRQSHRVRDIVRHSPHTQITSMRSMLSTPQVLRDGDVLALPLQAVRLGSSA